MAIQLKTNSGQVDLTAKLAKGENGGYYTPSVNAEGKLTWFPSDDDMPAVEDTNIRGPQGLPGEAGVQGPQGEQGLPGLDGKDGESGVYVGTEEPTDENMLIWINPDGTESGELATKSYVDEAIKSVPGADLTGYATEKYVDDAIAAINIPETDLTNYYTKAEVDNKIPNLEEYATETYVVDTVAANLKNYYTAAQVDEKGYQTEEQVNTLISAAIGEIENGSY